MPMFPLGSTLLPGALLPLQVFEPRYVEMMQTILADDEHPPEFGVTMIERGHEVGGGDVRATIGTVARIIDMQVTPDGRYTVVAVGTERLKITTWLPDDPYPKAEVELWPDVDDPVEITGDEVEALHRRVRELNDGVRSLGEPAPPDDAEISPEPPLAVYHLGALAPLGPADRQRMLAAPGLADRVAVLSAALDDARAVLEFRRS